MEKNNRDEEYLEEKIKNITPYFGYAVQMFRKLSESVQLADNDKIFETTERVIYPGIALLDDPYPVVQCRKRLFSRQSKIEVSYGMFAMLGMLGAFEEAVKKVVMYGLPLEEVWQSDKKGLVGCIKDALGYLGQACNGAPGKTPEMPELTMHMEIFYEGLKFMVGHELSHYLDAYISLDYRDIQQNDIRGVCFGMLQILQRTRYKKYADEFINNLSDDPDERALFYENMVAETLADYEGYLYRWNFPADEYQNVKHVTGVSLAFMALRLMEYFEASQNGASQKTYSIEVKWREIFLISMLYKMHNEGYGSMLAYANSEWYPYQAVDSLFRRAMDEMEAEKGKRKAGKGKRHNFSAELAASEKLVEKLGKASPSEVEGVFDEIDRLFDAHSMEEGFYAAFPAERLAETLCGIGYAFYENEIYDAAYMWWYRAVTYFNAASNPDRLLEADCYFYLGGICSREGNYGMAADWFEQALAIRKDAFGFSGEKNMELFFGLAGAYIGAGKYGQATAILEEMLTYTEDANTLKEIYRNMGIVSDKLGDPGQALQWFSRGLALAEEICGHDSLESATFYNSLGIIYYDLGEFGASEKYLMQAYELKKSGLDAADSSLANTVYSLGMLETKRGCYGKALEWFEEALGIRIKTLGESHPRVADTLHSMGVACSFDKDYEKALAYYKKAYHILKKTLGREHEDTIRAESNLELCMKKMAEGDCGEPV